MMTLVHVIGLHDTAHVLQATEIDVSLQQRMCPPMTPGTDGRAPSNVSNHTIDL